MRGDAGGRAGEPLDLRSVETLSPRTLLSV
jgi:hypothetical protein